MRMQNLLIVLLVILFSSLSCQSLPKKAKEYQLRPFRDVTLSNNLPVLLVPDRRLPYFQIILMVQSGSTSDPQNKRGLSHMTAHLLDKGTQKRSAEQLADSFEQLGSYFSVSTGKEFVKISASGLSFYREQLLKDFSEVLLQPAFRRNEIQDMKNKTLSHFVKAVDNPEHITNVALQSYLYGDHPYSWRVLGREDDVESLTRKDVLDFYRKHYTPQNSMLAVVGNFEYDKVIPQLESYLGSWKGDTTSLVSYPNFRGVEGVQILLVDRPDAKQTQVRLAHKGMKRSDSNFLTLRLANITLGGHSFGSRLMDEIRVKKGLTYSIHSGIDYRKDVGLFSISTSTRHEKVGEIVRETLNTLKGFIKEGVNKEELRISKAILKGQFPRALETAEGFTSNLLILRFYGIPLTYLTHFYINVNQMTRRNVDRVIRKYLSAENIKVVVYGPKDQIMKQLEPLGTVKTTSYKDFL